MWIIRGLTYLVSFLACRYLLLEMAGTLAKESHFRSLVGQEDQLYEKLSCHEYGNKFIYFKYCLVFLIVFRFIAFYEISCDILCIVLEYVVLCYHRYSSEILKCYVIFSFPGNLKT